jgi:hypothetical protein
MLIIYNKQQRFATYINYKHIPLPSTDFRTWKRNMNTGTMATEAYVTAVKEILTEKQYVKSFCEVLTLQEACLMLEC